METYSLSAAAARDGSGIDDVIEAAIASAARPLQGLIDGARHVEAFAPVA